MKMMEWPIVLTCSLQYWRRTGEWSAILPFYSLDRLGGPEVDEIRCETNAGFRNVPSSLSQGLAVWEDGTRFAQMLNAMRLSVGHPE
jgi:hypothetical protein